MGWVPGNGSHGMGPRGWDLGMGPGDGTQGGQGPAKGQAKGQLHHGPCPAMNGHLRRATDVILRPSESTIDFLSVFICFRSQISSKWSF